MLKMILFSSIFKMTTQKFMNFDNFFKKMYTDMTSVTIESNFVLNEVKDI